MFKRTAIMSCILSLNALAFTSEASSALIFNKKAPATLAVNMDWKYREGTVVIQPRNILRISGAAHNNLSPLIWKSRYGSVVFHAGNRFKPGPGANGMNEKGLTATVLMLKSSSYPRSRKLPMLNTSDWVNYVLDNFQNVQEVIDDSSNYQLRPSNYRENDLKMQLVVNDAEGNCAVLEYIGKRLVVHTKEQLNPSVITNTDYDSSLALLSDYKDFGGAMGMPGGYGSNDRFIRGSHYMKRLPDFVAKEEHVAYAFNGLSEVAQAPGTATPTQLSTVLDIPSKTVYFRSINESAVRIIPLASFDFDHLKKPLSLNAYQHVAGDVVAQFKPIN